MVNTGAVNEFTLDDGKPVKTFPAVSQRERRRLSLDRGEGTEEVYP
jgi:hypothetical protein